MKHINQSHNILTENEHKDLPKVVIESRFSSDSIKGLVLNKKFTLACMRDCFLRGEAPYASHVIYAQTHILDDFVASERAMGMHAGFIWGDLGIKTVVYTDLGVSSGMQLGIDHAIKMNRPVEYRELGFIPTVTLHEVALETQIINSQKEFLAELQKLNPTQKMCLSLVQANPEDTEIKEYVHKKRKP